VVVAASVGVGYLLTVHPLAVRVHSEHIFPLVAIFSVASLATELRTITTPAGDHKTITSAMFIALILLVGSTYALPAVCFSMVAALVILRRPWFKIVFNVAEYILTVGFSGMVYQSTSVALGGGPIPDYNAGAGIIALALLAVTYFVANSGLVAGVVALSEGRPFFYIWSLTNVEMLAQYAAMVVVGVIIAMLWETVPWSIVLIAVILIGVYISFALAESLQVAQRDLLLRMDELQRRTAELALLNQINEALTRAPDLARLWDVIYEQAGRVFDTTCFFVALRDDHGDAFQVAFGRAFDALIGERKLGLNGGLIERIEERRGPVLLLGDDAARVDDGLGLDWTSTRQSVLAAPLIVEGIIRGVIAAESDRAHAYTDDDLRVLAAIADQAAVAVEKTRLQREATETRALHRLNMLKAEFVSTVSHELRSPLTPIVGFSELLSATAVDSGRVRDMGAEILRHAQRMQRLVDDLLDVSHMEAGHFRLDMVDVDLNALLERTVAETARQTDRHRVVYHPSATLPVVRGDPLRLRQVLDNLLTNAIKYSPDGGRIDVVTCQGDSEVTIAVRDDGIGLPPDKIGRLFEKFYRVDNALAHRVRGSGLGLAIVKHIVDAHGGRVWVESELGRGSTFTFSLPLPMPIPVPIQEIEETGATVGVNGDVQREEGPSDAEAYIAGG